MSDKHLSSAIGPVLAWLSPSHKNGCRFEGLKTIAIPVVRYSLAVARDPTAANIETPFPEEIEEAKRMPGGYVYRMAGKFGPEDRVPPDAIVGAWKVDAKGNISGDFIKNENFDPQRWPSRQ